MEPLYIREGGSIPAVRFLEKFCNAPAVHLPMGQVNRIPAIMNIFLCLMLEYQNNKKNKKQKIC